MKLYDERTYIINAFVNGDIYPGDVERYVYFTPGDSEPKPSFEVNILETKKTKNI